MSTDGAPRGGRRSRDPVRTRQAIIDALLASMDDGIYAPTARIIAARAGISERSVFVHFTDLDDLLFAAARQQWDRVGAALAPVARETSVQERVDALLAQRERVFAHQATIRLVALYHARASAVLAAMIAEADARLRAQVADVLAPELALLAPASAEELLDAVDGLTGWGFRFHLGQRPGVDGAYVTRVARRTILALLRA